MNFHTGTTRLGSACQLGHREDSGKKTKKLQMSKGIKVLSILEFQMEHYFVEKIIHFVEFFNNNFMVFAVSFNYFAQRYYNKEMLRSPSSSNLLFCVLCHNF